MAVAGVVHRMGLALPSVDCGQATAAHDAASQSLRFRAADCGCRDQKGHLGCHVAAHVGRRHGAPAAVAAVAARPRLIAIAVSNDVHSGSRRCARWRRRRHMACAPCTCMAAAANVQRCNEKLSAAALITSKQLAGTMLACRLRTIWGEY